jgi:hypothetical protein
MIATSRPEPRIDHASIPAELKAIDQWVVWRKAERKGKLTKVPFQARKPHSEASTTDAKTWATFQDAIDAYEDTDDDLDGIGFVFAPDDGLAGVDLDNCLIDGEPVDWAVDILRRLPGYAEISPSGNGIKLFVRAEVPDGKGRKLQKLGHDQLGAIEVYDRGRYFTVTGRVLDVVHDRVEDAQAELSALHAEWFPPPLAEDEKPRQAPQTPVHLDDRRIFDKAQQARNGHKFSQLWAGRLDGYPSKSEADLALCSAISFYTQDAAQVERLFNQSGLVSEKWSQRPDYRARTIAKSLERATTYDPGYRNGSNWSGGDGGSAANEKPSGEQEQRPEPPPFTLGLVKTGDFFAETYQLEWNVKGVIVKGQACVFGGPSKTLKTSILIDAMISMASGTPFLGQFAIPHRQRVALISGESGRPVIQANAKQVCLARSLPYSEAGEIYWGFQVPQLCNSAHLEVVAKTIRDEGIEVIAFDPLYLALLAGNSRIDPKDMFQMGPLLADVAAACQDNGATPILCHHFTKHRDDPFGPPDMGELAYAGIGQFMRQWMLTSRRERYNAESGLHPLYFHYGGSAGHSGEMHIDIETGVVDEDFAGRRWNVTTSTPRQSREAREEQQKADKRRRLEEKAKEDAEKTLIRIRGDADRIYAELAKGFPKTKADLRSSLGTSGDRVNAALALLLNENRVRICRIGVSNSTGQRQVEGYEIVPPMSADRAARFFDPA